MELVSALLVLIGLGMVLGSLFYRSENAPPIASFNPKHWTPIWKQQSHFVGRGFFLMIAGFGLFGLGVLVRFVGLALDSWVR
ncbi:MAG: hypothetical protein AB1752_12015 [Candidatus Zixiibacteriota bacterium]